MSSYKEAKRRCPEISVAGNSKKRLFVLFSDFDFDFDDLAASQLQSADFGPVELDHPAKNMFITVIEIAVEQNHDSGPKITQFYSIGSSPMKEMFKKKSWNSVFTGQFYY